MHRLAIYDRCEREVVVPGKTVSTAVIALAALIGSWQPGYASDLVIAMPNWPSGQAGANILKLAIAEKLGLDAEVRELGTMIAFAGMDSGEVDVVPEVWRPNFDDLVKRYGAEGSKSVMISHLAVPAWQGLCATPDAAAAGIKDVSDLSDPAKTALLDTDGDGRGEVWIGARDLEVDRDRAGTRQQLRLRQDRDAGRGRGRCRDGGCRRRRRNRHARWSSIATSRITSSSCTTWCA